MNLTIGCKVRFLNEVGGGVVTKLLDKQKVMVLTDDGFEVPSTIKELVVISMPDNYTEKPVFDDKPKAKGEPEKPMVDLKALFYPDIAYDFKNANKIDLLFAFVPKGKAGNSDVDLFLINDSNYNALYSIVKRNAEGETSSLAVGMLEANTKVKTGTVLLANVNDLPDYIFQILFYQKGQFLMIEPVSKTIKVNPVRFYKENAYTMNDFFDENALIIPVAGESENKEKLAAVSETQIKQALADKYPTVKAIKAQPVLKPDLLEVDLHIQELLDDYRGLSNGEILEIQMERFKSELNKAMLQGPKKLVFIHGVGNGTLKIEVRKELDRLTKKLSYQDASFKEYGYGATMVKLF